MGHLQHKICYVCGRKWWVITLLPISSRPPPQPCESLRSAEISFCAYSKHDEWRVYLLLTGGHMISSGTLLGGSVLTSWTHPPLPHHWLSVLHKCSHIPWATLWYIDLSGCTEHSVITVTWENCTAGSTHTTGPHAYAETQITLFYYLPVKIIYGVITELHNEPGWLFKFETWKPETSFCCNLLWCFLLRWECNQI